MRYDIVIERTGDGYSAYVPDLPGCVAAADTRTEVEKLVREAISLHVASLRDQGEPVPVPRDTVGLARAGA